MSTMITELYDALKEAGASDASARKAAETMANYDLRSGLRETEFRLEAKIEATKSEIVKWMFGTIGFQTIIVLGAVVALARVVH